MKNLMAVCFCFWGSFLFAQTGYSGRLEMGINSDYNIMLNTTHGKYFNPNLFGGIGIGWAGPIYPIEDKALGKEFNTTVYPVFVEAEYRLLKTRFFPFISARLGGDNIFVNEWKSGESYYNLAGVFSPSIGLRLKIIDRFAFELKISSHFKTKETYGVSKQSYSYSIGLVF